MFHSQQLFNTLSTDRQQRFRNTATRQRLVRRNQMSPARGPSTTALTVASADDVRVLSPQRAHCAA